MTPELKSDWAEALRSGDFPQTKNTLMDAGGYCCLGVLAVICGAVVTDEEGAAGGNKILFPSCSDQEAWAVLPEDFMIEVGLNPVDADLLAIKNDDGMPFSEIADMVERLP